MPLRNLKLQKHIGVRRRASTILRVAVEAMRQILVDHAWARGSQKRRGSGNRWIIADVAELAAEQYSDEFMALEEVLCRFEQIDPRAAEVVK